MAKKNENYSLYGVIGNPLRHTLSPAMQNAALSKLNIPGLYMAIQLPKKSLKQFFETLDQFSVRGINVTVPYKEAVIPFLSELDETAKKIGAVNTIQRKGRRFRGYNTDVYGFLTSLKRDLGVAPKGKSVLVIGAGGAAKACLYGLLVSSVKKIVIVNRTRSKATALSIALGKLFKKADIEVFSLSELKKKEFIAQFDLIVNTSACGLRKTDPVLISKRALAVNKTLCVYDMIYNPAETKLLRAARESGHRVSNGLGMLLYQGVKALEIWTGRKAPIAVMKSALLNAVEN